MRHAATSPAPPVDRGRLADDLDVVGVRTLAGPSRWRREPAITGDVLPGRLASHPALLAGALDAIGEALPTRARLEVPAAESVGEAWAHAVASLATALQLATGSDLAERAARVQVGPGEEPDAWSFAIGYEEKDVGRASVRAAARLLRVAVAGEALEMPEELAALRARHARAAPDATTRAIVAEARRRGIPVRRGVEDGALQLGLGRHRHRLDDVRADARLAALAARDAGALLDALYPAGAPTHVPVVAVTGTNGKTTTTRLVAHLLRAAGHRVGFTTTDGVYVGDALVFEGDMTGPMAADMVLAHPEVDAAVLETARGGILRAGLGFDEADVGVVLNVTADHLGLRGIHTVEQLADVKAVIVDAVRADGHVVLNADDPLVWAMRERAHERARVVAFSLRPLAAAGAPAGEHVRGGGAAVTVEGDDADATIVLHDGRARHPIARVVDVPLTDRGTARFQLQNAVAATAAAWAAGVAPERIADALVRFVPSAATTPGRMNVVRVHGATIVVDYAHNDAAVRALLDYAARVDADRRIAVLSIPGDRRDADIRAMGALGAGLDAVVLMENPPYRRGRPVGENAALMLEGLVAAGGDAARAAVVHGQAEALDAVLRILAPRDLVLFVADDAAYVIGRLEASAQTGGAGGA